MLLGSMIRYQDERGRLPLDVSSRNARDAPVDHARHLRPGGSGIRAKLCPPNQPFAGLMIGRDRVNPWAVQVAGYQTRPDDFVAGIGEQVARLITAG